MLSGVNSTNISATGALTGGDLMSALCGGRLTAGVDAATAVIRDGSASGAIIATIAAPAGESASLDGFSRAVSGGDVHVTLTGTSPAFEGYWK